MRIDAKQIHLIAHSMGSQVLSQALSGMSPAKGSARFREIVLFAPDIDAELFRHLAKSIHSQADRITLYASSRDLALDIAGGVGGAPRAGDSRPGHLVILPDLMDTIDASGVETSLLGLRHLFYADNQSILSDLFYLIRGIP